VGREPRPKRVFSAIFEMLTQTASKEKKGSPRRKRGTICLVGNKKNQYS